MRVAQIQERVLPFDVLEDQEGEDDVHRSRAEARQELPVADLAQMDVGESGEALLGAPDHLAADVDAPHLAHARREVLLHAPDAASDVEHRVTAAEVLRHELGVLAAQALEALVGGARQDAVVGVLDAPDPFQVDLVVVGL